MRDSVFSVFGVDAEYGVFSVYGVFGVYPVFSVYPNTLSGGRGCVSMCVLFLAYSLSLCRFLASGASKHTKHTMGRMGVCF